MGKITSTEKFYTGRIIQGLEALKYNPSQEDIEKLFSETLEEDREFEEKVIKSLTYSYSMDCENFKRKIITQNPDELWDESFIKLYKGRDTLLKIIICKWYPKYKNPGILDIIKNLLKM